MRRFVSALLVPALGVVAGACGDAPLHPETEPTRIVIESRASDLTWGDTVTLQVRGEDRRGRPMDPGAVHFEIGDRSVLHEQERTATAVRLHALGRGTSWVVARVGELRDSVAISSTPGPIMVVAFILRPNNNHPIGHGDYYPTSGMCFSATRQQHLDMHGREWRPTQLAGFVTDWGATVHFRRSTEWTVASNPGVLEITPADHPDEIVVRPDGNGQAVLRLRDGDFHGRLDIWVDGINECRGIVPGLHRASAVRTAPHVHVW